MNNPIVIAFEEFMGQYGNYYREFYVGIAKDPIDRLANGHGIVAGDAYVYWDTPIPSASVRAIEKYFLAKGCAGGPGGGDSATCYLYAYRIRPGTRQ